MPVPQLNLSPSPSAGGPLSRPFSLEARTALALKEIIERESGIKISAKDENFLSFRLGRRLAELGLHGFDDYLDLLQGKDGEDELRLLIEHVTTHTTSFFREASHYAWLDQTGLGMLRDNGAGIAHPLLVWSAACSSGQELWSAAMVIDRFSRKVMGGLRWELLGTDLSVPVLTAAARAIYSANDLTGLSPELRHAYMMQSRPGASISPDRPVFRVVPELRRRAAFRAFNLVRDRPATLPLADVVFLRNVLIYFNMEDRTKALGVVIDRLRQGGVLLLGHSDGVQTLPRNMRQVAPATYVKE